MCKLGYETVEVLDDLKSWMQTMVTHFSTSPFGNTVTDSSIIQEGSFCMHLSWEKEEIMFVVVVMFVVVRVHRRLGRRLLDGPTLLDNLKSREIEFIC